MIEAETFVLLSGVVALANFITRVMLFSVSDYKVRYVRRASDVVATVTWAVIVALAFNILN